MYELNYKRDECNLWSDIAVCFYDWLGHYSVLPWPQVTHFNWKPQYQWSFTATLARIASRLFWYSHPRLFFHLYSPASYAIKLIYLAISLYEYRIIIHRSNHRPFFYLFGDFAIQIFRYPFQKIFFLFCLKWKSIFFTFIVH